MPFPSRSNSLLINSFRKSMIERCAILAILSIRQLLFLVPLDRILRVPNSSSPAVIDQKYSELFTFMIKA